MAKACISVPGSYGVGELKQGELEDALKWLLEDARFIHGGIDTKVSTDLAGLGCSHLTPLSESHP